MSVIQFDRRTPSGQEILNILDEWWLGHSNVVMKRQLLSDFGFFAFVGDKPVLGSFFYPLLGTDLCLWGFQVTNPDSSYDERTQAIDKVATAMSAFGKQLGYKIMIAYPGNKAIVKRLMNVGFTMGDEVVTQAIKEL